MQTEQKMVTTPATNLSEYDAIAQKIQAYIDGGQSGRTESMKTAFHEGATIFGYVGPDLLAGPIQLLYDWNDKNGPATELKGQITNFDIGETVATVRLELYNWTGHRFTDMFTLLKVDGEWKIINKVFYLHPEETGS